MVKDDKARTYYGRNKSLFINQNTSINKQRYSKDNRDS